MLRNGVVFLGRGALYNRDMSRLAVILVLGVALGTGCSASDPEAEIRARLAAAETAAEARDGGFFAGLIGPSYVDVRGNDREQLVRTIRGYFVANQRIEVVSRIDEIVVEGTDAARATVHAGLVGQRAGAPLIGGVAAELYRFDLELVRADGEWRIIGAAWRRALGD